MKSLACDAVLQETRERLLRLLPGDCALWGQMTAEQMVRHLICAYEMALGERSVGVVKGMPPAVWKWLGLGSGVRWPKNVATPPDLLRAMDEGSNDTFEERVRVVVEKMEMLASGRCGAMHPMFGPMTAQDWMRWGYLHTDHHLRQFGR